VGRQEEAGVGGFERLSAQDGSFLTFEGPATPMHVGAVAIFAAGPLAIAGGGIDHARIARHVESRLHLLPRYRKRLAFTPIERVPGWVDDERFELDFHVRRAALTRPGSEAALKELVARILSQPLDRKRPLWELWAIEGLEGERFAVVTKVHHSMVDGVGGANLLTSLFSRAPDEAAQTPPPWSPEPPPGALELLLEDAAHRPRLGAALVRDALVALRSPRAAWSSLRRGADAVAQAVQEGAHWPAPTRLNRPIGPHRRIEWLSLDLAAMKAVKQALGGTVNDVVLATVAGALRGFLGEGGSLPARLDYRIVVPVNLRPPGEALAGGNRVAAHFLSLPVAERDPARRYAAVRAQTERAKASRAAEGIDLLTRFVDRAGAAGLARLGTSFVSWLQPYHLIVTNVPGPSFPLWMLGAQLLEMVPQLPLFAGQGLGVAVLSYFERVGFGLVADRDLAPDLGALRDALAESFEELSRLASRPPARRTGASRPGRSGAARRTLPASRSWRTP
jgi:WS/DGAT/MGAT family acyltransferase